MTMTQDDRGMKLPWFGSRHVLVLMGFLGFANVYSMRVNLSVAIVAMVNHSAIATTNTTSDNECGGAANRSTQSHQRDGPFSWDEKTQGYVLGVFFYGYVLTQFPGGRLAELFGGKWLFGVGILVTAIFTLLTPLAAHTSIYFLYAVRVIEGLGEGVTFPAMMAMIAKWSTPQERSRFISFVYAGSSFGTVVSMPVSAVMCEYLSWESVFYLFGAIGVAWFVVWCFVAFDSPDTHPRISAEEKAFILESLIESESSKPKSIPWLSILKSAPVWAITATHVTQNFGFYVLLTELPSYMTNILHFNMKENAALSGLPYLLMWLMAFFASTTVDWVIEKKGANKTLVRKLANTVATQIPALALLGAAFTRCNADLSIALLCLAVGANGAIYSGEQAAMLDIGSNFAGTLMGIINALGNTMGFVAPMATGVITNHHNDIQHWQYVFFIATGVYTLGNLLFVLLGSAKEQPWNRNSTNGSEQGIVQDNPAYVY